jgi:hypothetical protein
MKGRPHPRAEVSYEPQRKLVSGTLVKLRFPDIATKWLALLVAFELALVVGLAYLLVVPAGSRITVENYKRIEHGMSFDEVVAILGRPPANQSNASDTPTEVPPNYIRILWQTTGIQMGVILDPSGKVAWTDLWLYQESPVDDTPLDRLKQWWKKLFP